AFGVEAFGVEAFGAAAVFVLAFLADVFAFTGLAGDFPLVLAALAEAGAGEAEAVRDFA
ncbi:MAG: hypothetical protein GX607_20165, partial [Myxococcales bacterium]|nr:hypothetical protein [Myxococcales bacterium]